MTTLAELVSEMVESDYVSAKRDSLVRLAGYHAYDYNEQVRAARERPRFSNELIVGPDMAEVRH